MGWLILPDCPTLPPPVTAKSKYINAILTKRVNPFTADPVKALHFAILV